MPIEAVVFDNDGVLVDSEILIKQAQKKAFNEAGYPVDYQWLYANTQGLNWKNIAKCLKVDFGGEPQDIIASDVYKNFEEILPTLKAVNDVPEMLSNLKIPYGIATSGKAYLTDKKLEVTGLKSLFNLKPIVTTDHKDVVNGKPSPDIFLCAAKEIGVVADNCLVVEDSPSGVKGGKAANMYVVGFTGAEHSKFVPNHEELLLEAGADVVIDNMLELPGIIEKLNKA